MSRLQFNKLFEPGKIGKMLTKNRIVMPPMGTNFCDSKGYINRRVVDYYEERAQGGIGLIIVECTAIDPRGRRRFTELSLADDSYVPGLRRLTKALHKHDVKVAAQLLHRGQQAKSAVTGQQPVAPSPVLTIGNEIPHELTSNEIAEIVGRYAAAARRAKEAGCDGVEIHGAHGYLISEFLSSASNKRTDGYGGTLSNKASFFIEVIQAIKKEVGPDYPVWCRLTAQEYGIRDGINLEETKQVARMAVEAGVDAIHVSVFGYGAQAAVWLPESPGALVPLAAEIKKAVNVPVIAVGWLTPEAGERALREGQADYVAIGRRLFADPAIAGKALAGKVEDINPCLGCLECVDSMVLNLQPARCTVNPALGKERQYRLHPARQQKRVAVVGGGPAGMEAARVAALRGHSVVLFEQQDELGGQLRLAGLPPNKEPIFDLINYLARQVTNAGVKVRLSVEATAQLLSKNGPDVVVVATGAIPSIPPIRGVDKPQVFTAIDILAGKVRAGKNVVIIGGGMVGCETGDFLAQRGHNVAIVEATESMAPDMMAWLRPRLLGRLEKNGVRLLTSVQCDEIAINRLTLTNKAGARETILADTIVLATGFRPNPALFKMLKGKVSELYHIGDSAQPAGILEAIDSGSRVGRTI